MTGARPDRPDACVLAVVPVKRLAAAKSRLALPAPARQDLALAFARDVVAAAVAAVDGVVVVASDERLRASLTDLPVRLVDEPDEATLPAAVVAGVREAERGCRGATTVVVPADMPLLTPLHLRAVLQAAARSLRATGAPAAFVPDVGGDGTTLLVQSPGVALPRYGPSSAREHQDAGAVRLADVPLAARQDVDTVADLHAVRRGQVGEHTAAALRRWDHLLLPRPRGPLLTV